MCNFAPFMMYHHDNLNIITKKKYIRVTWKKDFFSATRQ